ncbi:Xaa-Pro peptidase family protein [Geobacter sp. AOG1]|uniref:M24 family metallopeptidase n=1 Tax=Geobacter sp. AOG1 TaxID=1566346 RepID=UPI001CC35D31|nr:Xaa-Pro peptidase family protein [Geobacter sp. AOG1]GFE58289.1 integrase [Geobacter sp. AOG1]
MLKDRISSSREYLERFGVDAILFVNLYNIRYLCGFTGSDGALLVTRDGGMFLTDSRYTTQAAQEVTRFPSREYRGKLEGIASYIQEYGAVRVGFESEQMSVAQFHALAGILPGIELVPIGTELTTLRQIKDVQELELLARSADLASRALLEICGEIRPGAKERDVALALEFAIKRGGGEEKAFDFIVASGTRGALPHGKASDKLIAAGELVTLDFGGVYQGYCSDETVTVAVGTPNERQREIYGIVKEAHDLALAAVQPGIQFRELDTIARDFITARGYGEFFGHGLGHGVGLEVHEKPVVSFRGEGEVKAGMVFTIEPGIYIPGWGGVRIEDTVIVTPDGYRCLTGVPKELMIL